MCSGSLPGRSLLKREGLKSAKETGPELLGLLEKAIPLLSRRMLVIRQTIADCEFWQSQPLRVLTDRKKQ